MVDVYNVLQTIMDRITYSKQFIYDLDEVSCINDWVCDLVKQREINNKDIYYIDLLLRISNLLYNNTDKELLILDHGVYDIVLELYRRLTGKDIVGAPPCDIKVTTLEVYDESQTTTHQAVSFYGDNAEDSLFINDLNKGVKLNDKNILQNAVCFDMQNTSKNTRDISHNYPQLVGTLDKCKFVLNKQARDKGVFEDSNVKILERDFFAKHLEAGIISMDTVFEVEAALKYDGTSMEGDMFDKTGISRGDTANDKATDLSHLSKNYRFPNAPVISESDRFGIKFEMIMTYPNLYAYNQARGNNYKNCRSAINGFTGFLDGWKYMNYVTLVPLQTSLDIDRKTEVAFMNKYYTKDVPYICSFIKGTYTEVLFQIKKYLEEAEYMRQFLPFMYDGIVITYTDKNIQKQLGRVNSVNKYSMAVKFPPLKVQTIFTHYTYTVGQDGSITPMIHYKPVEFMGTIHPKSSGHSYANFKELNLRKGDLIDVEYVNDVMPYVTKPQNSHNNSNQNPIIEFPTKCPCCETPLVISETGKTARCPNPDCQGKKITRMSNMLAKINIQDFKESYIERLGVYTFRELVNYPLDKAIRLFGDVMGNKFNNRMNVIKTTKLYDYELMGSLGFTDIAKEKWKKILNVMTLNEFLSIPKQELREKLINIRGIGDKIIDTLLDEYDYFIDDIRFIASMSNKVDSKGTKSNTIRFTGFRDKVLSEYLNGLGFDADDKAGVTKDTYILLVPTENHQSSKIKKAGPNTHILTPQQLMDNMSKYL